MNGPMGYVLNGRKKGLGRNKISNQLMDLQTRVLCTTEEDKVGLLGGCASLLLAVLDGEC